MRYTPPFRLKQIKPLQIRESLCIALAHDACYLLAGYTAWKDEGHSQSFTERLIKEANVSIVTGSTFYYQAGEFGEHIVRFAFAKINQVLHQAGNSLGKAFRQR